MRVVIFLVVLTGCGRLGFGESGDDAPIDAPIDAPEGPLLTPQFCDDRVVGDVIGVVPVAIRAVAFPAGGYAVAIETTATSIPLFELDAAGAVVGTATPFDPGYSPLYGMSQHEGRPAVHLMTSGSSYIKFIDPGWTTYTTGPGGDPSLIDPSYAELDLDTGIAARIVGGAFEVGVVDDTAIFMINPSSYTPMTAVGGSVFPIADAARVVVEKTGGVCETFVVTAGNIAKAIHTFSPCYEPTIAATSESDAVVLHRIGADGPFAVHVVPLAETDPGTTYPLTGATYARVTARDDGAIWVGHGSGTYRALVRFDDGVMNEFRELRSAFYFDLTARDAFWIEGTTVHVSTPCLR